jgi:hypothetical protein
MQLTSFIQETKNAQDAHLSESCAHSFHEMFRKKKEFMQIGSRGLLDNISKSGNDQSN